MNVPTFIFILLSAYFLSGCTTAIKPGAEKIHTISSKEKENCQFLGIVNTQSKIGPHKAESALNEAINKVYELGGNSLFVISTSTDWAEGSTVNAEAYKCK